MSLNSKQHARLDCKFLFQQAFIEHLRKSYEKIGDLKNEGIAYPCI